MITAFFVLMHDGGIPYQRKNKVSSSINLQIAKKIITLRKISGSVTQTLSDIRELSPGKNENGFTVCRKQCDNCMKTGPLFIEKRETVL